MRLGKFTQDPNERKRYEVDFSQWLDSGELLSSVTFAVMPVTSPTTKVTGNTLAADNLSVRFFVEGGVAGTDYKIVITANTNSGQVKEDNILIAVRDE